MLKKSVAALLVAMSLTVVGATAASADPPPMTHNKIAEGVTLVLADPPPMTHDNITLEMTHN
jgi:hypothetical protein